MKTLNLFKSIKNISYLTAFACLPLSSACGEPTPQEIIEAYAKDTNLCWASGNVLAYKNINGDTIVLKSGIDFALENKNEEKDVKVVKLEEVLHYMSHNTDYDEKKSLDTPSQDTLVRFGNYCKEDNSDWYNFIASKYPYTMENLCRYELDKCSNNPHICLFRKDGTIITINIDRNYQWQQDTFQFKSDTFTMDPCTYIKARHSKDLHIRLDNFRHTEIQVQALWKKYNNIPTYNKKKSKKTLIPWDPNNEMGKTQESAKEYIKSLLPVALVEKTDENNPNHKIYSLFEACDACEKTNWLKDKKGIFMFAILDGQFTRGVGRYKVKDKNTEKPEEKKVVFMSQKDLEDKKIKDAPDIKKALEKDFESL